VARNKKSPRRVRGPYPRFLLVSVTIFAACLLSLAPQLARAAPLDLYGHLPTLEDVALSPNGSRIAFVRTTGDARAIVVYSLADNKPITGMRIGDQKLRGIRWADETHLMIIVSAAAQPEEVQGVIFTKRAEWIGLQIYDVAKNKVYSLPAPMPDHLRILNSIASEPVVRRIDGHTILFIRAYVLSSDTPSVLLRYDLDTNGERDVRNGTGRNVGWLVDAQGSLAAEEEYDYQAENWSIKVRQEDRMVDVARGHERIDVPSLLGFGPKPGTLLLQMIENGDPVWRLLTMRDGTLGPPMAEHKMLDAPIEDQGRMVGGVHVEDEPAYLFFDPDIEDRWQTITDAFPGERLRLVSAATDFDSVIVRVEGSRHGYSYQLIDLARHTVTRLGEVYDGLGAPLEVRRITYAAADGMSIPAYVTLPAGRPLKNLPLIVLPHGGPAARDTAEFDWWSQALANEGYVVLRPNYRGSDLNRHFMEAGFGEWGRKMQTDLSDGVRYLAKEGIVDPARVCIVGGSYGGYAALAGVTLDPSLYRCAVSVAGLADLSRFRSFARGIAVDTIATRYWDRFWNAPAGNDSVLDAISPIKHIDAVHVPVLLIHGREDTVVPYEQSQIMFDALHRAGKDVQLVTLNHEDHWLSRSETRLQMLKATVEFLRAHNPPN
jgi:dienelactone hydrolase